MEPTNVGLFSCFDLNAGTKGNCTFSKKKKIKAIAFVVRHNRSIVNLLH